MGKQIMKNQIVKLFKGVWTVWTEGNKSPTKKFERKKDAEDFAKAKAKKTLVKLIILKKDGKESKKYHYDKSLGKKVVKKVAKKVVKKKVVKKEVVAKKPVKKVVKKKAAPKKVTKKKTKKK